MVTQERQHREFPSRILAIMHHAMHILGMIIVPVQRYTSSLGGRQGVFRRSNSNKLFTTYVLLYGDTWCVDASDCYFH